MYTLLKGSFLLPFFIVCEGNREMAQLRVWAMNCCKAKEVTGLMDLPLPPTPVAPGSTEVYIAAVPSVTYKAGFKALEEAGFKKVAEYPGYDKRPVYVMVKAAKLLNPLEG